ncbi:unnamed protein product [Paramecium octaurelia]|uniref:Uncharacterized protein n=1 Tax=Paramecium octaurelia TaxID=43137 RepID=A0A8S1WW93_PAROT|nr:unnamed protein product [Paramecium octaurelia]
MSLSQAGRQAINPITGESRFQPQEYRRSQEVKNEPTRTAESRRNFVNTSVPVENQEQSHFQMDRIAQLQDQVQMLEKQLTQEVKRNSKMLVELEREVRTRGQMGDPNQMFEDLQNKMYSLETKIIAQDRQKSELGSKVAIQEQNIKELLYFLKNTQNKDTNEVLQMRGMLQEKITEESSQLQKEREKTKALFMEMVRLGELQEKLQESLSTSHQHFEQRINGMESKIYNGEKALIQVAQRGDSGMNFINETNERIEKRVMALEANLLALGKDQLKDHEQINRVDMANQRIQEEFKGMLQLIQQDYTQRLDTRVTEVINRIVMEHEQRVKTMEEMKQAWSLKDQINMERLQYEREEVIQKLGSLEQFQRIDSQKKDEAIRSLQTIIETQVNQILVNIQNEEAQRYSHEVQLRGDLLKIQENIKSENELFKTHQANITEKITDMIRIEVQTRLSTDTELKNLTSAIATDIVSDLNSLKDQIEMANRALQTQVKQLEKDQAEKAERLSLYIDDEINKAIKTSAQKYEKVKVIFSKFGESFKQHITAFEGLKQDLNSRQTIIEQNIDMIRQDFQTVIEDQQSHLLERISIEKNQILEAVNATVQFLEDKVNKLDEDCSNKFRIFREVIEENQQVVVEKTKLILDQNESYQQTQMKGLKLMAESIQELKSQQQIIKEDHQNQIKDVNQAVENTRQDIQQTNTNIKEMNEIQIQHKSILDENQTDIEILKKENETIMIKQQDIDKNVELLNAEQKKIHSSFQILTQSVESVNEKTLTIGERVDSLNTNFQQLQEELRQIDQKNSKLEGDLEDSNLKVSNDIKSMETRLEDSQKTINAIQDAARQNDDLDKKQNLEIDELQQSVKNLQDRLKQLAQLPA